MKTVFCLLSGLAACGAVCQPAGADVTIEMKHNGSPQVLHVAENALRVDSSEGTMIFRGDEGVLWAIDEEGRSYHEITREDLEKMGEQLASMKLQMEEAMKNMPPEQRAMAEKMMAGKLPSAMPGEKETTIKALEAKKTINGFETDGYQVYLDGVLDEEVWTASPKALNLTADDFGVFKVLSDFLGNGIPGMEDYLDHYAKDFEKPDSDEVPGFPVLAIRKDKEGKDSDRTELVKLEKGKIDPARFALPEGLEKNSIITD